MMDVRKLLILLGSMLLALGIFWPWIMRLGLGRLPGDVVIERPGVHIYFPIVTCLLISVVLSLLFWVMRK